LKDLPAFFDNPTNKFKEKNPMSARRKHKMSGKSSLKGSFSKKRSKGEDSGLVSGFSTSRAGS
jgi:hypothetical protein